MGKETGKLRAGTAAVNACTGGAGHGCGRGRWLRASLGGEECEVAFWTPPQVYISIQRQPKGLSYQIFAIASDFGPVGLSAFQKKIFN